MLVILHCVDEFRDARGLDVECLHLEGQINELDGTEAVTPLAEMRNERGCRHGVLYVYGMVYFVVPYLVNNGAEELGDTPISSEVVFLIALLCRPLRSYASAVCFPCVLVGDGIL